MKKLYLENISYNEKLEITGFSTYLQINKKLSRLEFGKGKLYLDGVLLDFSDLLPVKAVIKKPFSIVFKNGFKVGGLNEWKNKNFQVGRENPILSERLWRMSVAIYTAFRQF